MTFTSLPFAIFFAIAYCLWLLCRREHRLALLVLLVSSWVFYAHEHWPWLGLLLAYVLVDWSVGRWIASSSRPRLALGVGLGFNLGVLAYWKCIPLFVLDGADWTVPYGLSFYAFIGVAYLVDVYRRQARAEADPLRFAVYLSFFPHLIAGPILRPREFLTRLQADTMPMRAEASAEAVFLLGRGCFKKAVLADRIARAIDPFFLQVGNATTDGVWAAPYVYLYAMQIYLDFSGYTDIARGLALLFGFRWPENFRSPYLAASLREFWQRWHITLSLFLRDYLYIPLGGGRRGEWRARINIMATFMLGGLWHGSRWTFVIWGAYHGALLIIHRAWAHSASRARLIARWRSTAVSRALAMLLTFHCVCIGWCFFRLSTVAQSFACLRQCLTFDPDRAWRGAVADPSLWVLLTAYTLVWLIGTRIGGVAAPVLSGVEGLRPPSGEPLGAMPLVRGFAWGVSISLLALSFLLAPYGERPPFIYFQF